MDTSELKPGDIVLVHAQVSKRVDDGEGSEPVVLATVDQVGAPGASVTLLLREGQIEGLHTRPEAPVDASWPLGTLNRGADEIRAQMQVGGTYAGPTVEGTDRQP